MGQGTKPDRRGLMEGQGMLTGLLILVMGLYTGGMVGTALAVLGLIVIERYTP